MHLIRSYLYIFLVLQLVFFSYCDDDVNPDGNVIENGKRNTNPLEPSVLPSSQNLGKGDPNIDLPAVENATKKNTDILLNVTDNKTDSADGGSSSKQKPSVKKELNQPLEFNVTTEIPLPLNVTPHIVTVKITKIDNENSLKPSTPGEIHNTTSKVEGTPSNSTKVEDTAPLKSGAKKRGVIVFGTLGVLSIAYFAYKYYRKKKMQRENDSSFYQTDNQNFKYGVLLSNDNDDNLELSNLPLTVDSEDEEIEIFDIEQKKFLDNNKREAYGLRGNLLAKDDIEILDLDLPGTSDGSSSRTLNDDNLLNLSDVHLHDVSVIPSNVTNNGFKPNKANDFFDVL